MTRIRVLEMIDKPFLGGGQRNLLSLAASLDRDRFEVAVCSGEGGPLVDEVRALGIPYHEATFNKRHMRKSTGSIERILSENHIDILHTHGGFAGFFGRWAGRRCGIPVMVHTLHGIHYLHYRNPLLKKAYIHLERKFSRYTSSLILVCESDRKRAIRHGLAPEDKMTVIQNGVDPEETLRKSLDGAVREEKREKLGLHLKEPVLGTVARLHRQKGIPHLIRAMARISRELPEAVLVIVGGGPEEEAIQKCIAGMGLEDRILILGEREDAVEILSLFDVFVLPSLWEGLPYVLLEAALLRKPVVATSVDGVLEVIQDGHTGLLVPPGEEAGLADAVLRMIRDPDSSRRMADRLKSEVVEKYTLTRMVDQIQSLYHQLWGRLTKD